jgi:hypothetical protein
VEIMRSSASAQQFCIRTVRVDRPYSPPHLYNRQSNGSFEEAHELRYCAIPQSYAIAFPMEILFSGYDSSPPSRVE